MIQVPNSNFQKIKNFYHLTQAVLANIIYGFPSKKIKVVGVTGTDGKTTTTHLIYHILKSSGKKVSMISSVHADVAGEVYDTGFHITTPSSFTIQKYLKLSVNNGDEYFILETTSHALDQNRVWGINYDIGVVTNITHEHLDYHETYNNYLQTKAKLLFNARISIINSGDGSFSSLKHLLQKGRKEFYFYKVGKLNVLLYNTINNLGLTDYNKANYLAASTTARVLNIDIHPILAALKSFKLPKGRLETVYDKDFKVIIDFAHTPNAITQLLNSIKSSTERRIIHIFGSAGLRDITKRPLMGEASSKYSDLIILTEEDYRTEDPLKICEQIAEGINRSFKIKENIKNDQINVYTIIIDRKAAIEKAISLAQENDVVIITGKGHEKSLCRGKKEYPWDDKKAVLEIIDEYDKRK